MRKIYASILYPREIEEEQITIIGCSQEDSKEHVMHAEEQIIR